MSEKIGPVLIFPEFLGRVIETLEALDQSGEDFGRRVEHRPRLGIADFPSVGTQMIDQPDHLALEFLGGMKLGAARGRIHGLNLLRRP